MAKRKKRIKRLPPPPMIGRHGMAWLTVVMRRDDFSAPLKLSAVVLARHLCEKGEDAGLTWPSHETISESTGTPVRSVSFHIATLQEHGLLWVAQAGGNSPTRYRCIIPMDAQLAATPSEDWTRNKQQVQPDRRPAADGEWTRSKLHDGLAASCKKATKAKKNNLLKNYDKSVMDSQVAATPNRDRTESRTEARGAAPLATPPLAAPIVAAVPQIPPPDEIEPFEDTLARALGARNGTFEEPLDFAERIPSDAEFSSLDAGPDGEDDRSADDYLEAAE